MGENPQKRSAFQLHRFFGRVGIEELEREWCALAESFPPTAPFCRPHTWLSWYQANPEIHGVVFELREESRLIAVLGMYESGNSLYAAADRDLDYQDVVAVSVEAAARLLVMMAEFCESRGMAIIFAKVVHESLLGRALSHRLVHEEASVRSRYWSSCPFHDFKPGDEEGIFSTLSKKKRTNFRRKWRAIQKEFPDVCFEHLTGAEIEADVIELVRRMHQEAQQRRRGRSIFENSWFTDFLVLEAVHEHNLELFLLRTKPGGDLLAFGLGYFQNGTFYYYLTGYDARFAKRSPGMLLLVQIIRELAERSGGESFRLDFLSGMERYKEHWASETYKLRKVRLIPRKARTIPLRCACSAAYTVKAVKNRMLTHLGVMN